MKSLRNKKILVTGAAGFIGTNLIMKLSELGAVVTGTLHNNLPQHEFRNVKLIKCDLTRVEDCLEVTNEIDDVSVTFTPCCDTEISPLIIVANTVTLVCSSTVPSVPAGVVTVMIGSCPTCNQ